MVNRNLRVTLLIALSVHVIGMSVVSITTPANLGRRRPYTRVDFLGPILRKTVFDIMLENTEPVVKTTYRYPEMYPMTTYLEIAAKRRESVVPEFPEYPESTIDVFVSDFLMGVKAVPDFFTGFKFKGFMGSDWESGKEQDQERKVIYKPEAPSLMTEIYGDEGIFKIKVRILVDESGNVKNVEPVTTTGYPQLDIIASKFVSGWIFEPNGGLSEESEWCEVEVVLKAGD